MRSGCIGGRGAVEEELLIPFRGNPGISMVDSKKRAEWKMTEEGLQVVIPHEYREERRRLRLYG